MESCRRKNTLGRAMQCTCCILDTGWPDENEKEAVLGTTLTFLKNTRIRQFLIKERHSQ